MTIVLTKIDNGWTVTATGTRHFPDAGTPKYFESCEKAQGYIKELCSPYEPGWVNPSQPEA